MSYHVYITRKANWYDEEGPEIPEYQWRRLVAEDPELTDDDGEVFWRPAGAASGVWLEWSEGSIFTSYPAKPTLLKMEQLAERLGAKVQGEEEEIYKAGAAIRPSGPAAAKRPWWKFWA